MTNRPFASILRVITASFAILTAAGCGGGGGGGSSSPPPTPIPATLTGTVDFSAGHPAANYTVKFGNGSLYSTTTNTQGQFTINFDAAQIPGSEPLFIYDTTGALIDKETVNVNSAGGSQSAGTVVVGPPAPPA
jgi:hypothetical protein